MASRLTSYERKRIKYLRETKKYKRRKIGEVLWRDHTVLSKEYKRNKKRWGHYDPKYAWIKAKNRSRQKKKQCKKIRLNDALEQYILENLEVWWTAEKIAWRRNKIERKSRWERVTISGISIRRYIDSKFWCYIKYVLLQEKKLKKYKKKAKRWKRKWGNIKHRVFIDVRPEIIDKKEEIWHMEVDFIESIKWDTAVILVLIDKALRVRYGYRLPNKKSETVLECLENIQKKYKFKSMTFDNDNWFALHYKLPMPTYFCHTYSSWEKWQVERWNKGYRKFFPKWSRLGDLSQEDIDPVVEYLNNLPMKCLEYLTPNEYEEIKKEKQDTTPVLALSQFILQKSRW